MPLLPLSSSPLTPTVSASTTAHLPAFRFGRRRWWCCRRWLSRRPRLWIWQRAARCSRSWTRCSHGRLRRGVCVGLHRAQQDRPDIHAGGNAFVNSSSTYRRGAILWERAPGHGTSNYRWIKLLRSEHFASFVVAAQRQGSFSEFLCANMDHGSQIDRCGSFRVPNNWKL